MPTGGIPYPLFSYCALLPWTFFATGLTFAIPSLVNNYNLVTKTEKPLGSHASAQNCPAICEGLVVWNDWQNGSCDIYGYDLNADEEAPIHLGPGDQEFPAVSYDPVYGHVVVWEDDGDIYATLPEPATLALLGVGVLVGACRTSRGRRARGSAIGARI